jgi:ArsR family transcriptional regulator
VGRRTDDDLFEMQADIARALANPTRLRILSLIGSREVPYRTLLRGLGISKANLSQHLSILRRDGVVAMRRDGVHTHCRLTFPEIKDLCATMRNILTRRLDDGGRQARLLRRRAE